MPFLPTAADFADQLDDAASARLNGQVPEPKFSATDASADARNARYDVFGCTVEYEYDEGLLQCPAAAGSTTATFAATPQEPQPSSDKRTPCAFVRVHAPASRMTVTYYGRRTGDWPRLPAPTLGDANLVLLSARTIPEVPILDDSGALYVYACHVVHTYGLVRPVTNQDGFAVGTAPFTQASLSQNRLTPGDFVSGLIG